MFLRDIHSIHFRTVHWPAILYCRSFLGCRLVAPRKDCNKCGLLHTRQQAVHHTFALNMNTGHVLCFQSSMKQLDVQLVKRDSGLSQITVGHIAHECLINQMYHSMILHYKQTYAVIRPDLSHSARWKQFPGPLCLWGRYVVLRVEFSWILLDLTSTMTQSILSFILLLMTNFSATSSCLFILPLCSTCVISTTSFIVSCDYGGFLVIICHTCPLKDNNELRGNMALLFPLKKDLHCQRQYRYPVYNVLDCQWYSIIYFMVLFFFNSPY